MRRPPLAIVAVLALSAAVSGCSPQCTCPATVPAPAGPPPAVAAPGVPAAAPAPTPSVGGSLRIINDEEAEAQMRALYPRQLADVGVGADVLVDVTLDANGFVQSATDVRVSNPNFRGPALTVAHTLQFTTPPAADTVVRVRMRWRTANTTVEIVQP